MERAHKRRIDRSKKQYELGNQKRAAKVEGISNYLIFVLRDDHDRFSLFRKQMIPNKSQTSRRVFQDHFIFLPAYQPSKVDSHSKYTRYLVLHNFTFIFSFNIKLSVAKFAKIEFQISSPQMRI
jgi:hypothetical protein